MEWISKNHVAAIKEDVSIKIHAKDGEARVIAFTLRNEVWKSITKTDYLRVAIDKEHDRLYFGECGSKEGFKICKHGGDNNRYFNICSNRTLLSWAFDHVGDYQLQYDQGKNLFYVGQQDLNWINK